jgi:hypothetical protein
VTARLAVEPPELPRAAEPEALAGHAPVAVGPLVRQPRMRPEQPGRQALPVKLEPLEWPELSKPHSEPELQARPARRARRAQRATLAPPEHALPVLSERRALLPEKAERARDVQSPAREEPPGLRAPRHAPERR